MVTAGSGRPVAVRIMVKSTFMDKLVIYSVDNTGTLCTAHYDEIILDVILVPVANESVSNLTPLTHLMNVNASDYKQC